jgi:drug/metabolite transporter (DMT)-like permease
LLRRDILGSTEHGVLRCEGRTEGHPSFLSVANRVPVYQYLISLTGVASGVVFFGEVLRAEKLVGGAVTLAGVYLARRQ